MNRVIGFFEKVGHEIKVLAGDAKGLLTKLFGAQAINQLETTAETILKSDFGQAVLSEAELLLGQVKSGQISQHTAITQLSATTIAAAKSTGVELEASISTAVASLAIAKLTGVLNSPNEAVQGAVDAVTQPPAPAQPAAPEPTAGATA